MNNIINLIRGKYETPVSDNMMSNIDDWEEIYQDNPFWSPDSTLGLGKEICQTLASQMLTEADIKITGESKKATFIQEQLEAHLLPRIEEQLEKAMATGGMVLRPYIYNGGVNIDFCRQGQFLPLAFDDDGNITDIAFGEQIVDGKTTYTRIERQRYDGENVLITNQAFSSQSTNRLGNEIELKDVEAWKDIDDKVELDEIGTTCFGYYKIPLANNIDMDSPLGIAIFSPAISLLAKADAQFNRLDWEYEGGQIAIDISEDAILPDVNGNIQQDQTRERIYRGADFNDTDTYKAFAPTLRDASYNTGLDKYLMRIEDKIGLARGSLSQVDGQPRTATEIVTLKERTYKTIRSNQQALYKALETLVKAIDYLAGYYYDLEGEAKLVVNWNDGILEDYQTELDRHQQRIDMGIESTLEARMWAFGEDEATALDNLAKIDDGLEDIYSDLDNPGEPAEPGNEPGGQPEAN